MQESKTTVNLRSRRIYYIYLNCISIFICLTGILTYIYYCLWRRMTLAFQLLWSNQYMNIINAHKLSLQACEGETVPSWNMHSRPSGNSCWLSERHSAPPNELFGAFDARNGRAALSFCVILGIYCWRVDQELGNFYAERWASLPDTI